MTSGCRILIVEDNALNLKLASDILEAKAYTVFAAQTGSEGLRIADEAAPDVILLDVQLPDIDGIAVLERLRAERRTRDIPVIAFTASVTATDRSRVKAAHFDALVTKPIDLKSFLATIEQFATPDDE